MNRPSRPSDPGFGDGWNLTSFLAALERDRQEMETVLVEQPEQVVRLRDWLKDMALIGDLRDTDPDPRAHLGEYLETLKALGYSGRHAIGEGDGWTDRE